MNRNLRGRRLVARVLLAMVSCGLCTVWACRKASEFKASDLPQTPAGQCAVAYFSAFNSDGDEMLRVYLEEYRSPAYLQQHSLEKLLAHHNRFRGIFQALTPAKITLSLDLQITLLVDPDKKENTLVMRFQLEEQPPHKLSYITFSGIDHADVSDEYVAYVATRAAPAREELRESTVRSVSQALRDVYVYPELGQRMADTLLHLQASGAYRDLTKAGALADKLTEDVLAVSGDLHIWVEAQNPMVQVSNDPVNRDAGELRRDKFDFREARMLPGNIGYIKFDMIHDEEEAQEIIDEREDRFRGRGACIHSEAHGSRHYRR
jgi:hypothetical protein